MTPNPAPTQDEQRARELPPVVVGNHAVRLYLIDAHIDLRSQLGAYATEEWLACALASLPIGTLKRVLDHQDAIRSRP